VRAFHHHGSRDVDQSDEMFDGISSGIPDILQSFLAIQSIAFSNFDNAFGSECALGIDVYDLAIAATFLLG
jgi:hypothetical protein